MSHELQGAPPDSARQGQVTVTDWRLGKIESKLDRLCDHLKDLPRLEERVQFLSRFFWLMATAVVGQAAAIVAYLIVGSNG